MGDATPKPTEPNSGPNSVQNNSPQNETHEASAPRNVNAEADILQILCEFDAGLEGLKAIYERRKSLETALLEKQNQLVQRERELSTRRSELERSTGEISLQREAIELMQAQTSASREEIETNQRAIDARIASIESEKNRIESERQSLEDARTQWSEDSQRRDSELSEERERLRSQIAEVDNERRELAANGGLLAAAKDEIAAQQRAIEVDRASLIVLEEEVSTRENRASAQAREIAVRELALRERESTIASEREACAVESSSISARSEALAKEMRSIEEHAKTLTDEIALRDAELSERESSIETRTNELVTLKDEIDSARVGAGEINKQLAQQRDAAVADLNHARTELERVKIEAEAKGRGARALEPVLEAMKKSLLDAEDRLAESVAQAESSTREGVDTAYRLGGVIEEYESLWRIELDESCRLMCVIESTQQRLELARTQIEVSTDETNQARRALEVAQQQAATAQSSSTADNDDARSEVAELVGVVDALKDRLRKEFATREEAQRIAEAAANELAEAGVALKIVEVRAADADAIVTKLRDELARASFKSIDSGNVDAKVADHLKMRRERLRRYRAAVRAQLEKVRKAGEIVKKRYEQAEQVLSHRAELAAIRERVIEAERATQAGRATTRVAQIIFFSVAVVAILGAMSWAVSRQISPAAFMAQSTISADGRGRDLLPAELDEWARFHEGVLKDPLFHEATSERFKRLGLAQLGTPVAVRDMINTSITTDDATPGQLHIRMIGTGADRTERVMEAFTSAFASFANSLQQKRIDGAATKVAQAASVGEEPIDNTRTYYALGILGAGFAVVSTAALGIWSRLARAKTSFELDQHVAAALVGTQWADLPKVEQRKVKDTGKPGVNKEPKSNLSAEDLEAAEALKSAKASTKSPTRALKKNAKNAITPDDPSSGRSKNAA